MTPSAGPSNGTGAPRATRVGARPTPFYEGQRLRLSGERTSIRGRRAVALRSGLATLIPVGLLAATLLTARPAAALTFTASMTGAQEIPSTDSPATGVATLTIVGNVLSVDLTFSGLTGGPAAAGASAALISGLQADQAYTNVHDATFPGGEIRGNLVPEPSTSALLGAALVTTAALRRARLI